MGVKVDLDGLKALIDDLQKINVDAIMRDCSKHVMAEMIRRVTKATPVGKAPDDIQRYMKVKVRTGELKKNGQVKTATRSFLTAQGLAWHGYRGGTLRRGWTTGKEHPSMVHYDNVYSLTVTNPTYYGDYVDKGHRQHKGMFVPAIGKRLKRTYVPGQRFVETTEDSVQRSMPQIVGRFVENAVREALKGDS